MWWNRICLHLYLILLTNGFWPIGGYSASFPVFYFYETFFLSFFFFYTDLSANWWHNVISKIELGRTCSMKYILTEIYGCLDVKTFCREPCVDEWGVFSTPGWGLQSCLIWKLDWKLDLSNPEINVSTLFQMKSFCFHFKIIDKLEYLQSFGMNILHCHPASLDQDLLFNKQLCQTSKKGCRTTATVLFLRSCFQHSWSLSTLFLFHWNRLS